MQLLKNYRAILDRYTNGKTVLGLLAIMLPVYCYMLFVSIPDVMQHAGNLKLLDMMLLGYSFDYVMLLFDSLGEEGRNAYLTTQIPIDMVFPFLLASSFSLLLAFFFRKGFGLESRVHYLSVVPVAAGLFDYFENFGIIAMLTTYPDISYTLVSLTSLCSMIRAFATSVSWLLLLVSLAAATKRRFRTKPH
ncbi:MAG: hypothetical protein V3T31_00830 [candidate division Zixibacteria bacterium]